MSARRLLGLSALWGALLTLVILSMSVLLRLGTRIEAGEAVSTLPAGVEQAARIAHRVAAAAVGVFAASALVLVAKERPPSRERRLAACAVVVLTVALAMIGRYTPGYRVDAVTVVNVMGGVGLAAAFWWLRSSLAAPSGARDPAAVAALALLLVLAALGAGADAAAMRGERAFGPAHLWLASIFLALAIATGWRARALRLRSSALVALAMLQYAMGFALVQAGGARPMALAWTHAMVACVVALLLVSLAAARAAPPAPPAGGSRSRRAAARSSLARGNPTARGSRSPS